MNRKVVKIISILLMVLMVITMLSTSAFASSASGDDPMGIGQFNGQSQDTQTTSVFRKFIATIINLVQVVGMGVAIIMLVVMAIKYISAAPSEKAELKKSATIYVVGAIVLFAASGILQVIKNFATANIQAEDTKASSYVEMVDVDEMYLG